MLNRCLLRMNHWKWRRETHQTTRLIGGHHKDVKAMRPFSALLHSQHPNRLQTPFPSTASILNHLLQPILITLIPCFWGLSFFITYNHLLDLLLEMFRGLRSLSCLNIYFLQSSRKYFLILLWHTFTSSYLYILISETICPYPQGVLRLVKKDKETSNSKRFMW